MENGRIFAIMDAGAVKAEENWWGFAVTEVGSFICKTDLAGFVALRFHVYYYISSYMEIGG